MLVYRITNSKYSSDISGTGAALYPGRWNQKGSPVLYTGESIEIALLETIVHTPPLLIPTLDLLTIEIPNDSITELKKEDLPLNWKQYPAPDILAQLSQNWVKSMDTIALRVPSCIVDRVDNIILNCAHPEYNSRVKIRSIEEFYFDRRLSNLS